MISGGIKVSDCRRILESFEIKNTGTRNGTKKPKDTLFSQVQRKIFQISRQSFREISSQERKSE